MNLALFVQEFGILLSLKPGNTGSGEERTGLTQLVGAGLVGWGLVTGWWTPLWCQENGRARESLTVSF